VVGLGIVTTFLVLLLKEQKPLFAVLLATFVGVAIAIFLLGKGYDIFQVLKQLATKIKVNNIFLETIFKIICISYIAEFGAQVSRDAGQGSIAYKIELAGKILIIAMSLPIISLIIEMVISILPS